jgi:hypothetical protein
MEKFCHSVFYIGLLSKVYADRAAKERFSRETVHFSATPTVHRANIGRLRGLAAQFQKLFVQHCLEGTRND